MTFAGRPIAAHPGAASSRSGARRAAALRRRRRPNAQKVVIGYIRTPASCPHADLADRAAGGGQRARRGAARHRGQQHDRQIHQAGIRTQGCRCQRPAAGDGCPRRVSPPRASASSSPTFRPTCCSPSPTRRPRATSWSSTPERTDDALRGRSSAGRTSSTSRRAGRCSPMRSRSIWSWKKWTRWFLIVGSHAADQAYADGDPARGAAFRRRDRRGARVQGYRRRAHHRFRAWRRWRRRWPSSRSRRADHHVVVVADESEVFGPYVPYHTWSPAPVAGTDGLQPASWSPAHDQWGAIQMQNRFVDGFHRLMTEKDIAGLDGGAHRSARRRRAPTAPIPPRWSSSSRARASRSRPSRARS